MLTPDQATRAREMRKQDYPWRKIGKEIGVSTQKVRYALDLDYREKVKSKNKIANQGKPRRPYKPFKPKPVEYLESIFDDPMFDPVEASRQFLADLQAHHQPPTPVSQPSSFARYVPAVQRHSGCGSPAALCTDSAS